MPNTPSIEEAQAYSARLHDHFTRSIFIVQQRIADRNEYIAKKQDEIEKAQRRIERLTRDIELVTEMNAADAAQLPGLIERLDETKKGA